MKNKTLRDALEEFVEAYFNLLKAAGGGYLIDKLNKCLRRTWWGRRGWHKKYKAHMMLRAGLSEALAEEHLQAGLGEYDYDDDPEESADMEMSYWGGN